MPIFLILCFFLHIERIMIYYIYIVSQLYGK